MKERRYADLVAGRKQCRLCVGLRNPADAELAVFDSDEIGPWTRWLGDRNARLMIVGQDWGDVRHFKENEGIDDCTKMSYHTNRRLRDSLQRIGVEVPAERKDGSSGVFLTNAVLCLKSGGVRGPVKKQWFDNCRCFLRRQIEIVSPDVVVTLGVPAYRAVASAFTPLPPLPEFSSALANSRGVELGSGCRLVPVYHPMASITKQQQKRDWARVKRALRYPGAKHDLERSYSR